MGTSLNSITDLLIALQSLLLKTRDPNEVSIENRNTWVSETLQRIKGLKTETESKELLRDIRTALRGGMGSFMDIYLFESKDSDFSETEINTQFESLINEIYDQAETLLDQL